MRYDLRYDRPLLEKVLREAKPEHVVDIFVAKVGQSHLEPDDEAALIKMVAEISGAGKRQIAQRIKQDVYRLKRDKLAAMEAAIRPVLFTRRRQMTLRSLLSCGFSMRC